MDNQDNQGMSRDDGWIDEILPPQEQADELLPDEDAMASAGLTHPADQEVIQIIQETLAKISEEETAAAEEAPQAPFVDDQYRDEFGDTSAFEAAVAAAAAAEFGPDESLTPDEDTIPADGEEPPRKQPDEPEPTKRRPVRKGKDNLFGLTHILATCIWLFVIIAIGVSLGNMVWLCASDVLAFGRDNREVSVTIEDSDTTADIADKLYTAGLVRYPNLFTMYARLSGAREEIGSGTFTLNTMYDYHALVNFMNAGSTQREIVTVVIPEGYTCAQIFKLLEEKGVCTVADLEAYAADGELDDYWFLENIKRGDRYCLEGFLFPDTYEFYVDDDPERVLEKLLDDFDYRFTDAMRSSLITLNQRAIEWMEEEGYSQEYIDSHQIGIHELVIVASLIEKETASTLESYTISSVIYNRLYRWGDTPSFLNIDAAIIYALGEHKEKLSSSDLQIDSPYNTYTHVGLTPGAICNPGLYSLNAALDPDDTDYYYYAMDPEAGAHHFSGTEDEHNAFLESLGDE